MCCCQIHTGTLVLAILYSIFIGHYMWFIVNVIHDMYSKKERDFFKLLRLHRLFGTTPYMLFYRDLPRLVVLWIARCKHAYWPLTIVWLVSFILLPFEQGYQVWNLKRLPAHWVPYYIGFCVIIFAMDLYFLLCFWSMAK